MRCEWGEGAPSFLIFFLEGLKKMFVKGNKRLMFSTIQKSKFK